MSIQVMMQMLGQGFLVSLQLFVLTLLGSIPLGIPVAFMRMSKVAPLRWIARIYISVMRGTPLMLQMFAIYFAPYYVFGISLTPDSKWMACVVAFIINYAGYFAEIYRSGLQSIPRGQYEAAEVLGYSRLQTFLYIVDAAGRQAHFAGDGQRDHHAGQGHVAGVCHRRGRDVLDGQGAGRLAGEHGAVCDRGADLLGL